MPSIASRANFIMLREVHIGAKESLTEEITRHKTKPTIVIS